MHHLVAADRDLYALLGIKFSATSTDIRVAYRRAALTTHPDKGGTKEAFQDIKIAFEVLSSSLTRRLYNRTYTRQRCGHLPVSSKSVKFKPLRTSLKRCSSSFNSSAPQQKRQRCCGTSAGLNNSCNLRAQEQAHARVLKRATANDALESMRLLLQSMTAAQRLNAIQSVVPHVRSALLGFMQKPRSAQCATQPSYKVDSTKIAMVFKNIKRGPPQSGRSGVRVITSAASTKYRAHLVIKGLRLYTNASSYEAAIEHHILFVQMRDVVAKASFGDTVLWTNPAKVLRILEGVLADSNTSHSMIGLQVFIYMRATQWLDKNTYIVSAVMQLPQAVALYSRLLSAQSTSWESLRTEWLQVLKHKQRFQAKKVDAETIVDQARGSTLQHRFKQAEQSVKRLLRRVERETCKARAVAEREARKLAAAESRLIALERREAKQRMAAKQRRQNWQVWKDMTMEDMRQSTYTCT